MAIPTAREYAIWPKDRTVTVSDGTPIAYTVVGDGPKTPILFVNGWTCSDAYWVAIAPSMVEAGHPVILVDTRGHGESGLPRDPGFLARNIRGDDVSTERLAKDVLPVLVRPAVSVGSPRRSPQPRSSCASCEPRAPSPVGTSGRSHGRLG